MALIIEDGTGKSDAESYISVSDADAYVAKWYGTLAAWDDLANTAKEIALRKGTRFVDSHDFRGYRTNEDQALDWPRANLWIIDGQHINSDKIPQAVERATVEAAVKNAQGETLFPDHDGGTVKSESSSVGPLSTSTTYQGTKKPQKTFEAVKMLLAPFVLRGSRVSRGIG